MEVVLTYPTPEGSREIVIDGGRATFGRGSEAEHRFVDDGLSRLHATIYKDGERIWIVDENSSNGTFVNGVEVKGAGIPLKDGDSIKIGHQTVLRVQIRQDAHFAPKIGSAPTERSQQNTVTSEPTGPISIIPIALIAIALLVVSTSGVFIAFQVFGNKSNSVAQDVRDPDADDDPTPAKDDRPTTKPSPTPISSNGDDKPIVTPKNGTVGGTEKPPYMMPAGKTYMQLSESEKREYLRDRSMRIAQIIGNNKSDAIPDNALDKIKSFTEGFASRVNSKSMNGCPSRRPWGDNLQSTYERASKNAPFIIRAFNEKGVDPRIGLYLAMIESEHCVCLQSHTGPLGMFQFTKATGELHGLKTRSGATPDNPDERCEPEPAARAAASYMKALTARYGTGPASVPLAIGSYNSGEGGLSSNLVKALESGKGLPRDFWTLIANGEKLSAQFQSENFKYVPKFFAAAIIGEHPHEFGLKLKPLSSYSN